MGVVFLAEDESLSRNVALKVLDRNLIIEPDFEARFRHEAKTIARLDHPNIVQIHALEAFNGDLAIDMAYIAGGPLSDAVASPEQAVKWVGDVLGALERCHETGIVHRDVKPSNILLSADDRALLSDFGLAKLIAVQQSAYVRSRSSSCMFVGTPRYAPPEAWDGGDPSPVWDVYSVGMVLYEKFAPTFPYDAETPLALLKQMMARSVPPLCEVNASISPAFSECVAAMIAFEPDRRPADASAALRILHDTPEFRRADQLDGSTMIPLQRRLKSIRRRVVPSRWLKQRLSASLLALLISTFILVLAGSLLWKFAWRGPRRDSDHVGAAALNLSLPQVFDTVDPSGPSVWPAHWLMEPSGEPNNWRVLATADSHVWLLSAREAEHNQFTFAGNWAEYSDSTARTFRYGECAGSGRLVSDRNELAVTLKFKDVLDAEKWTKSFLVRPAVASVSPEDFLLRLETNDYIPALLYNELQPRNLAWFSQFEQDWLHRVAEIVTVPFVDTTNKITVDGRLDEPAWQSTLTRDIQNMGQLASRGSLTAILYLRYSNDALYLGIRANGSPGDCYIETGVLRSFDVHTAHSPRWMARLQGNAIVSALYTNQEHQVPWTCEWQGATTSNGSEWQAEIRIPFENLMSATLPTEGQRWRLSCDLHRTGSDITSTPIACWGHSEHSDIERGLLIAFGSKELNRSK